MPRRWSAARWAAVVSILWGATASAESLDLGDAIGRALAQNAKLSGAAAAVEAAEAKRSEASSAFLPRVDYRESFARSDNPVFVFGTLLNQGRFTEANFAIDALNNPNPVSLFQSQFRFQQVLFSQEVFLSKDKASLGSAMAEEGRRQAEMGIIFETVRAYHGVQVALENVGVLEQAIEAAETDLERAQALYDAGQVTEADLLALRVNVGDLKEQAIRAKNTAAILRSELNQIMGEPLEAQFDLSTAIGSVLTSEPNQNLDGLEALALENNPDAKRQALQEEMAELDHRLAKAAFLPSVHFNAGWESDRVSFLGDGGTNWVVGVAVNVNLFEGLGKTARIRAAAAERRRAAASRRDAKASVRLEVRRAALDEAAARERVAVAGESVEQARESHRITQARYEGGLTSLSDLLRSQNAVLGAEARSLAARYEARLAEVRLALVTGTLDRESEVLKP